MELLGSLFLVLALIVAIALFIGRPFFSTMQNEASEVSIAADSLEHRRSGLLAERDRILGALQELEFDFTLGKIPAEDYPDQRAELLRKGSFVLRQLDSLQPNVEQSSSVEDRIEAAVASRRVDGVQRKDAQPAVVAEKPAVRAKDSVEDLIASRRRQRQEKAAGFCPRCGRPVSKSDKFCAKCGATL
jgi:hypothetical protein